MELKQYLADTFRFNDKANKQLLEKIKQLPDQQEAIRYFSHLINCQYKWLARIEKNPDAQKMDWWEPVYRLDELEQKWNASLDPWFEFLNSKTDEELMTEVKFSGYDGSMFAATPGDIALQLNYHSIHHRAQIQTILRKQGIEPDFIDYIGSKYRRV